ncbi:MAG: zinc ribbon domain-containing protein [Armatimonadetes bacterium]|nr:zinc ribbon domain-containing protein [Armatimonadota bacterium]
MPTYAYACRECGARTEVFQRITDDPLTICEACGGRLRRLLFPVGIVYKGTGFYTTDYARKSSSNGRKDNSAPSSEAKTEAAPKKVETKSTATTSD